MEQNIQHGNTNTTPEAAGFIPQKTETLNKHFINLINQEKLQGASYILSRRGKVFAWNAMGKLSGIEDKGPLQPDSIRGITSFTKVFTTTAIMQLIESGKLYLEQPLGDIIEEFNNDHYSGVTIFHLLTHTSGIVADGSYFMEPFPDYSIWETSRNNKEWIKLILSGPRQAKPGEQWSYSSSGFAILGEIINRTSGMHYSKFITENIIEPLGLKDTTFKVPESEYHRAALLNEMEKERLDFNKTTSAPFVAAGGLYSSLHDLWKFGQMMLNKGQLDGTRILGRVTVDKISKNQFSRLKAYYWGSEFTDYKHGIGWYMENRNITSPGTYGHEGAGRIGVIIDPAEELVYAYYAISENPWLPESCIGPYSIIWSGLE